MTNGPIKHYTRRGLFGALLAVALLPMESEARGGCGSRGGPGGARRADGKCPGWNDYQGGYDAHRSVGNRRTDPKREAPKPARKTNAAPDAQPDSRRRQQVNLDDLFQ